MDVRIARLVQLGAARRSNGVAVVALQKPEVVVHEPLELLDDGGRRGGSSFAPPSDPYLALRVLDADGNEVKPARRLGRFGRRRSGCYLERVKFVTRAPGEAWSLEESLTRYMHDADLITGWTLARAGTYTLEFTYHFDRAARKKRCDPRWKPLHDPERAWNKAIELKHVFRTEMRVR